MESPSNGLGAAIKLPEAYRTQVLPRSARLAFAVKLNCERLQGTKGVKNGSLSKKQRRAFLSEARRFSMLNLIVDEKYNINNHH